MKRVRVISDLHIEQTDDQLTDWNSLMLDWEVTEFLCLCGDIGHPNDPKYFQFLKACTKLAKYVVIIAGNHEYYHRTIGDTDGAIRRICLDLGIIFLQREEVTLDGVRFLGCTLWSEVPPDAWSLHRDTGDFKQIKGLSIERRQELHRLDREFLETHLTKSKIPTVVCTHHLPSFKLVSPEYSRDSRNVFYATELASLIGRSNYWFCGHTHHYQNKVLYGAKCLVNPLGYLGQDSGFTDEILVLIQ